MMSLNPGAGVCDAAISTIVSVVRGSFASPSEALWMCLELNQIPIILIPV